MGVDSCVALDALRGTGDGFMASLLEAARAVKAEQRLTDDAEAFDYTVSFLSGVYRAMAIAVREPTLSAMGGA
jgi:hypothetical protein